MPAKRKLDESSHEQRSSHVLVLVLVATVVVVVVVVVVAYASWMHVLDWAAAEAGSSIVIVDGCVNTILTLPVRSKASLHAICECMHRHVMHHILFDDDVTGDVNDTGADTQ